MVVYLYNVESIWLIAKVVFVYQECKSLMKLITHYRKLLFFLCNRFKADNYAKMREYLTGVLIEEIEAFVSLKGKTILDVGGAGGVLPDPQSGKRLPGDQL